MTNQKKKMIGLQMIVFSISLYSQLINIPNREIHYITNEVIEKFGDQYLLAECLKSTRYYDKYGIDFWSEQEWKRNTLAISKSGVIYQIDYKDEFIDWKKCFEYNESVLNKERNVFIWTTNNSLTSEIKIEDYKYLYSINKDGGQISRYCENKLIESICYKKENNVIREIIKTNEKGSIDEIEMYNEYGCLKELIRYNILFQIEIKVIANYNTNGNITRVQEYGSDGLLINDYQYLYDSENVLIKRICTNYKYGSRFSTIYNRAEYVDSEISISEDNSNKIRISYSLIKKEKGLKTRMDEYEFEIDKPQDYKNIPETLIESIVLTDTNKVKTSIYKFENGIQIETIYKNDEVDKVNYWMGNNTKWKKVKTKEYGYQEKEFNIESIVNDSNEIVITYGLDKKPTFGEIKYYGYFLF